MPASDAVSQRSTHTQRSSRAVLRWYELSDGLVGKADHSITHPVVTALTSVVSQIAPGSRLQRDFDQLSTNRGKYRPFIVTRKPRGNGVPAQIVLTTHFDGRPIQEVDESTRLLSVALGTVTPPHPLPTSPRIMIDPEWTEENSYAIAYAIGLDPARHPTRLRCKKLKQDYNVNTEELDRLRAVCIERTKALATMSPTQLAALKGSYEARRASYGPASRRGTQRTQSRVSTLASIAEDGPATPTVPNAQAAIPEVDEDGFTKVTNTKRRASRGNSRGG